MNVEFEPKTVFRFVTRATAFQPDPGKFLELFQDRPESPVGLAQNIGIGHGLKISARRLMYNLQVMFEMTRQTYWSDSDPAGIVFYPNYFRFIEEAEEELFRAAGFDRFTLLQQNKVWMPRAETFAKFVAPIRLGTPVRIRLYPKLQGEKTVRYDFEFVKVGGEKLTEGYVTVVCVDAALFKATAIPGAIRRVIESAAD